MILGRITVASVFSCIFYNLNVNSVMYLGEHREKKKYTRKSKLGQDHEYYRTVTVVELRCDECGTEFSRPRGSMDPNRLNNNYFHVCSNCDAKRFAQKKGVERKQVWNMTASSSKTIGRL